MEKSHSQIITKLFFRLLPVQILIIAISSLNSIIDGAVASNFIGSDAMAVIGLFSPLDGIFGAIDSVMVCGAQILCGQFIGKNQLDRTNSIFTSDLAAIGAVSFVFALLCLFTPGTLASFTGTSAALRPGFIAYSRGRSFGVPFLMLTSQLTAFLQLERQEKRGYVSIAVMLLSNLAFDLLFVCRLHMGLFGLGLATSLSYLLFFLTMASYYFGGKSVIRFTPSILKISELKDIVRIGTPGAVLQICLAVRGFVMNYLLIRFVGSNGLASYAVLGTFGGLFFSTTLGVTAAARLLMSVYVGEEDRESLSIIVRVAVFKGVTAIAGIAVIIILLATPLARLFYPPTAGEIFTMTRWGFIFFALSTPFSAFTGVFNSLYQCFERTGAVSLLSAIDGVIGMCLPAVILTPFIGMMGVWWAQLMNGVITVAFVFVYARVFNKHRTRKFDDLLTLPQGFGVEECDRIDISIDSVEDVVRTSGRIMEFCQAHGITGKRAMLAGLSMEEMAGNIVEHGFNDGKRHSVDVRVAIRRDVLVLRLKDDCRPFDPKERAKIFDPDDIAKNVGVRMISRMVGKFTYQNALGLNVLIIEI